MLLMERGSGNEQVVTGFAIAGALGRGTITACRLTISSTCVSPNKAAMEISEPVVLSCKEAEEPRHERTEIYHIEGHDSL